MRIQTLKAATWVTLPIMAAALFLATALGFDVEGYGSLWGAFFGGFHPLVLHLPIGVVFVLVARIVWFRIARRGEIADNRFLWSLAAATSTLAFATGYLAGSEGGYDQAMLSDHLWMAAGFCSACWIGLALEFGGVRTVWKAITLTATLIGVSLTGHYGGLMVHGDPLAAAPWLNDPQRYATLPPLGDEVSVYQDLVDPILQAKCVSCHGPAKRKGDLRLDSLAFIRAGGKDGPIVMGSDPDSSPLLAVTKLPLSHEDHMPPEGKPQLRATEQAVLSFWIEHGGGEGPAFAVAQAPEAIRPMLEPGYRILPDPVAEAAAQKAETERLRLATERRADLASRIAALPEGVRECFSFGDSVEDALRFAPFADTEKLDTAALGRLGPLLAECEEVNLAYLAVPEATLAALSGSTRLLRLSLKDTRVTEAGLAWLAATGSLESLNLFATGVSVDWIPLEGGFPALRRLYLGGNGLSIDALSEARRRLPDCRVFGSMEIAAQHESESPLSHSAQPPNDDEDN